MRGQVLGVDTRTGHGKIAGDDGTRYSFTPEDWAHRGEPAVGMYVDFETEETRALTIFPVPSKEPAAAPGTITLPHRPVPAEHDRNKIVAALLAFFLGPLGIHRFYLGRTGSGIVMLVLTCTIVGLLVTGIWAFVDFIRYLIMSDREFAERYARNPN
ncbi:MAG TPA: TM2 domain-containing protein [Allosphingosinicella sp.]|jgi:TM2 domain-containing membrane protein YozV